MKSWCNFTEECKIFLIRIRMIMIKMAYDKHFICVSILLRHSLMYPRLVWN